MKTDDRYDLWRCERCGRFVQLKSLPLQSPVCCRTGMWFVKLLQGPTYIVDEGEPVTKRPVRSAD